MKKLIAPMLSFICIICFAACSGNLEAPSVTEPVITSGGVTSAGSWFTDSELEICGVAGLPAPQGITPGTKTVNEGGYTPLKIEFIGLNRDSFEQYVKQLRSFLSENCGGAFTMNSAVDENGESSISFKRITRLVSSDIAGDEFFMFYKTGNSVFRISVSFGEDSSAVTVQDFTSAYGDALFGETTTAEETENVSETGTQNDDE